MKTIQVNQRRFTATIAAICLSMSVGASAFASELAPEPLNSQRSSVTFLNPPTTGILNFPGDSSTPRQPYCSPSIGCVGTYNGKNVYARTGIQLTPYESQLLDSCQFGLIGVVLQSISSSKSAVIGGVLQGLFGPWKDCNRLLDSLHNRGVR